MSKQPSQHGGRRPGSGRKPIYKQLGPPISVRLEAALQAKLDAKCEAKQITRTAAIQEAIKKWVGRS